MSTEDQPLSNPPKPFNPIETNIIRLPQAENELLPLLAQALNAQVQAGDTSGIDKIIDLQGQAIVRDQQLRQQEIDLANKQLDQTHELAMRRENRLREEGQATRNITKLIIAAITFAFAGSLGLGALIKDTALADKIFTGAMSALGGSGLVVLSQKKEKETDKDTKK